MSTHKSCDNQTLSHGTSSASLDKVVIGIMSSSGAQQHHVLSIDSAMDFIKMVQASIDDALYWSERHRT